MMIYLLQIYLLQLKYTNERAAFENVIFIDFQFAYWSSCTTDLHDFLNKSINESIRPQCYNELVEFYYKSLAVALGKLNFKQSILDRTEFYEQYQERHFAGKKKISTRHFILSPLTNKNFILIIFVVFILTAFVNSCMVFLILAHNDDNMTLDELVQNTDQIKASKRKKISRRKSSGGSSKVHSLL